jgi:hypothetical protein
MKTAKRNRQRKRDERERERERNLFEDSKFYGF